jgi:hypothetical protein
MARHALRRIFLGGLLTASSAALTAGCIVEHNTVPPADTQIVFGELQNLGATCASGHLSTWTVTNRENGDSGTAGCEQPIVFQGLAPNTSYSFDIVGTWGNQTCWQGACAVYAYGETTTVADCSSAITHLCGF